MLGGLFPRNYALRFQLFRRGDTRIQLQEAPGLRRRGLRHAGEYLQRNPVVTLPVVAQKIGISAPTVAKSLEHLRLLGIVRETTGRERNRLFVYESYLAIPNEGTVE
jgi:predicted transcriptional regulator